MFTIVNVGSGGQRQGARWADRSKVLAQHRPDHGKLLPVNVPNDRPGRVLFVVNAQIVTFPHQPRNRPDDAVHSVGEVRLHEAHPQPAPSARADIQNNTSRSSYVG